MFSLCVTGEDRVRVFSDLYSRMCYEDSGVRICGAFWGVPTEWMEFIRFYNCSYRVSIELSFDMLVSPSTITHQ